MEPRQEDQARLENCALSGTERAVNAGTTDVREGFRFDEVALARWIEANVAGYSGPLNVEQFKGGQSNPTYKLVTPGASYVLRRKPPGELLKGAHVSAAIIDVSGATALRIRVPKLTAVKAITVLPPPPVPAFGPLHWMTVQDFARNAGPSRSMSTARLGRYCSSSICDA